MPLSPDAILGALVTVGLAGMLAFWQLATMLAEVRGQVRHNGGSTLKDYASAAKDDARAAREVAESTADLLNRRLDKSEARAIGVERRVARQLDDVAAAVRDNADRLAAHAAQMELHTGATPASAAAVAHALSPEPGHTHTPATGDVEQ